MNTDTEQDEQRDHEVVDINVDINASVGEHSDTEQGPTPDQTEDQKFADSLTLQSPHDSRWEPGEQAAWINKFREYNFETVHPWMG